jgi:hypothetical protein
MPEFDILENVLAKQDIIDCFVAHGATHIIFVPKGTAGQIDSWSECTHCGRKQFKVVFTDRGETKVVSAHEDDLEPIIQ